jgi:hypothetical protein
MMPITALAEPATSSLLFAKGSGHPAFNHDVGAAAGTLAWKCDPANTAGAGFMQSGPYLVSLPAGAHTVHFRMSVDAISPSATNLVCVDVRENAGGAVLAKRDVAWNWFAAAGESQDIALAFTNHRSGPLEFRVFWNHAPGAPALTLSDVTVGGSHSWTAANLGHDLGQLDGLNAWCADPVRNRSSGFLTKGAIVRGLSKGAHAAVFELKVDNFNRDKSKVATVSVVDADTGETVAARDLARNAFSTTLYHNAVLNFKAGAGRRYEFRTFWHSAPHAPRLTQRSVIVISLSEKP